MTGPQARGESILCKSHLPFLFPSFPSFFQKRRNEIHKNSSERAFVHPDRRLTLSRNHLPPSVMSSFFSDCDCILSDWVEAFCALLCDALYLLHLVGSPACKRGTCTARLKMDHHIRPHGLLHLQRFVHGGKRLCRVHNCAHVWRTTVKEFFWLFLPFFPLQEKVRSAGGVRVIMCVRACVRACACTAMVGEG